MDQADGIANAFDDDCPEEELFGSSLFDDNALSEDATWQRQKLRDAETAYWDGKIDAIREDRE